MSTSIEVIEIKSRMETGFGPIFTVVFKLSEILEYFELEEFTQSYCVDRILDEDYDRKRGIASCTFWGRNIFFKEGDVFYQG